MRRLLLCLVLLALMAWRPYVQTGLAQANPIAADRRVDWSVAGATIATGRTVCYTDAGGLDTLAVINAQIASCAANGVVQLGSGTYNFAGGVLIQRDNVTLRGNGPHLTFLSFTGVDTCSGLEARICVRADTLNYTGDPQNVVNWTAGYSKGTTVITLSSVTNLSVGSVLMLDQLDDSTTDTNTIWIGDTVNVHCYACASPSRGGNRAQIQTVHVTAISGTDVTIDPPIMWPNFASGKTPQAWYPTSDTAVTGVGIENLSIDSPATGAAISQTVTLYNAYNVWLKNVRMTHVGEKAVRIYQSTHVTIRDSYVWDKQDLDANQEGSESYGFDVFIGSSNLFENNILEHLTSPLMCESGVGNVYAYNYTRDDFYTVSDPDWAQASSYNHGVCGYNLYEGNYGFGFDSDVVHSSNFFHTNFRNRYEGWETGKTLQAVAIMIYAANRYQNVLGNVLGTDAYHTRYESFPTDATACNTSIYAIGWGGNCGNGAIANKVNTRTTLFRWGNYDTVNDAVRWVSSEVPTTDPTYPNAEPPQVLPVSLYLAGKPSFFGSNPYPPIGPDVTGGTVTGFGGHVNNIPAKLCYDTGTFALGGTTFNAPSCYERTIFVNNQHPSCNNANAGTDNALPLCDLQTAGNLNLVTAKTTATVDHVEIAASSVPYRLFGTVSETTAGMTWQGTGATPGDVMIMPSVAAVPFGITTTSGRTNICQFNPATLAISLFEHSRPTDLNRLSPPAYNMAASTEENGVLPYFEWHARGAQPNLVTVTGGNTVTIVQGKTFYTGTATDTVLAGKEIIVNGVSTTISSVTNANVLVVADTLTNAVGVGSLIPIADTGMIFDHWGRDSVTVSSVTGTTVNLSGTGAASGGINPYLYPVGRTIRDSAAVDRTITAYTAYNQLQVSSAGMATGTAKIETFDTPCPVRGTECTPPTFADMLDVIEKGEGVWAQDMATLIVYLHPLMNRACSALTTMEVITTRSALTMQFREDNTTLRNMAIWGTSAGNNSEGMVLSGDALAMGGNDSLFEDLWTFGGAAYIDGTNIPNLSAANLTIQDNIFANGMTGGSSTNPSKSVSGLVIRRNLMLGDANRSFTFNGPSGLDTSNRTIIEKNIFRDSFGYKRRLLGTGAFDWYQGRHISAPGTDTINGNLKTHAIFLGSDPSVHNFIFRENVVVLTSDFLVLNNCTADCLLINNFSRGGVDLSGAGGTNATGSVESHNNVWDSQTAYDGVSGASTSPMACASTCPQLAASSNNIMFSDTAGDTGTSTLTILQAAGLEVNSAVYVWNSAQHNAAYTDRSISVGVLIGGDDYRPAAGSVMVNNGNDAQCAWTPTDGQCDVGAWERGQHTTTGPWNPNITNGWLLYEGVFEQVDVEGPTEPHRRSRSRVGRRF